MALFIRQSKTRGASGKGQATFRKFTADGNERAITIKFQDKDNKKIYSMTIYGIEIDTLQSLINEPE